MGTRYIGDSKDPAVNCTTWFCLVVVSLAIFARLWTKWRLYKVLKLDDGFIALSLVCLLHDLASRVIRVWAYGSGLLHRPECYRLLGSRIRIWKALQQSLILGV